jgi:predicted alpha-1,2-mannosidase
MGKRSVGGRWWALTVLASGLAQAGVPSQTLFWRSFEPDEAPPSPASTAHFSWRIAGGPTQQAALTARPDVGFSGLHSLRYQGEGSGTQAGQLFEVNIPVRSDSELSYLIFPQSVPDDLRNPANYVAVDLQFDDGSFLSQRDARDQHRTPVAARAQGQGRVLYPDQWNLERVALGKVAAGRTIKRVLLTHDDPDNKVNFQGYLDDLRIGAATPIEQLDHPSDHVDTRRGSNANGRFSRGNNFPAVALPHGFNFWTPTTNAGSSWIYQYAERNGSDNRPRIEAFALSHEPSPWMGDRQTFQLMPEAVASGAPLLDRTARALGFDHTDEVARPYYYKVDMDGGLRTEITPTDHAAMFRFTFPGVRSQLVFDNKDDHGAITLDPATCSISGWSEVKSGLSTGATRLFFYAQFDQPISESGRLKGQGRDDVSAWFGFDTRRQHVVNMRIATSLISLAQAKHNLALEIAPGDSFDSVRLRAQQAWDARLGIVSVQGASSDERTTLYGNLYRLFLYPNAAYENTGSAEQPLYQYASPFSPPVGADSAEHTGARIVDGKVFVNNGFWDTYRTAWPAYVLLTPHEAGEMIDGFVQQYRDGGWIARWSSPGYADLMVGTSADVAFADAWLKGVRNFDVASFYQSALKDATVLSPIAGTGRKGLERSIFTGYTDTSVDEGLSWSMDGYINDFGIANLAAALAKNHAPDDPYGTHYADDAQYFRSRALNYVKLFQPGSQFFVGRNPDGSWRYSPSQFNPERWGGDYTETDGWNMAFHAPQDGAGLAALYGGRARLAAKLDGLFNTPGRFDVGSYGGVIHEMLEARDVRMGQYGHSNQPSHHLIYMYDFAGQPWKAQDKLRDALRRLYVGSEIGQGYPGDEDNGEMSAWWLWSAAGIYPLRMGSPDYVIGAPYFAQMTIRLENGQRIQINAPGVSDTNRYVQSLSVNGQPWSSLSLPHALLAQGAVLDFVMGPTPSRWGSAPQDAPPSLSAEGQPPQPLQDLAGSTAAQITLAGDVAAAKPFIDNDSATVGTLPSGQPLQLALPAPATLSVYTLTSARQQGADPQDWLLEGSDDGQQWRVLDRRQGEHFSWRQQTRAFALATPARARYFRWRALAPHGSLRLAEIEWLGQGG